MPQAHEGFSLCDGKLIEFSSSEMIEFIRYLKSCSTIMPRTYIKEAHAVNTVRGLSKITGENWSYIAKILRVLGLPEAIKDFGSFLINVKLFI